MVRKEYGEGLDVVALSLALQTCLACSLERRWPFGHRLGGNDEWPCERIVEHRQCSRPVGHAASRIGSQHTVQDWTDQIPGEGVVIGHRMIELFLRDRITAHLEMNFPELTNRRTAHIGKCFQPCDDAGKEGSYNLRHGHVSDTDT